jgi:DNA invertase Pin-like site-specific DNA recombinase
VRLQKRLLTGVRESAMEGSSTGHSSHSLQQLQVFVDKQSARTADERPQFQEMLAYCRKHHKNISCVVVSDLSRFARNVADQGQSIAELKRLGIKTISVDEPMVDDTAAGRLAANMLGVFNQ